MNKKAILLAGGTAPSNNLLCRIAASNDLIIAADSGADMAVKNNIAVDLLVGDLDSLSVETKNILDNHPLIKEIKVYPQDKDQSDLEIALKHASLKGIKEVTVLGALGGRLDHALFNVISLLEIAGQYNIKATLIHDNLEVFQMNAAETLQLNNRVDWLCSVISLDNQASISLKGFRWPLDHATIKRTSTLCLSNQIIHPEACIFCEKNKIIVILSK